MTNETILRIAHVGTPEAEAILHRVPIDELTPDDAVSARTEVVFGIPLSPEAFVERVRLEVRARGDDALREIGARLGETVTGSFETSREEIEAPTSTFRRNSSPTSGLLPTASNGFTGNSPTDPGSISAKDLARSCVHSTASASTHHPDVAPTHLPS